jgi:hypothetical protein
VPAIQQDAAAADLLEAIVAYDLARWPAEYARALDGDPALLRRYLTAFNPVPEELRGILIAMPELAVTPGRITELHRIWQGLQDRLLPRTASSRNSTAEGPTTTLTISSTKHCSRCHPRT